MARKIKERNPFIESKAVKTRSKTAKKYGQKLANVKKGESLSDAWTRLAKQADQRLVRLEKLQNEIGFESVTQYAYARAMRDLKARGKKNRFNTKKPKDANRLKADINAMLTFLNSPTSTKKGIVSVYKKRAETINQKYGTSFTWQELADYYTSGNNKKLDAKYGSEIALVLIGIEQKKVDVDDIKGNAQVHIKSGNGNTNQLIYDRIASQQFTLKELKKARMQLNKSKKGKRKNSNKSKNR